MEPKKMSELIEAAKQWKTTLEALIPDSTVEITESTINSDVLFTWLFENDRPGGFKQTIQMEFNLDGTVTVNTQHGTRLDDLSSYEDAENWILNYLKIPESVALPTVLMGTLPSFSERNECYDQWLAVLNQLKPYGVEIYTESEFSPFQLYLPKLESVLANTGEFEREDESVDFDPGKNWAEILSEQIIKPLKELYAFSSTKIPDLSEELKNLQLNENHTELYNSLNAWINWFKELSKKIPFKMFTRDIWSVISQEKCHFDGEKVVDGIKPGGENGVIILDFHHDYLFNGDQSEIRAFSGKLYFFTNNKAVLKFSGTSLWGMKYRTEKFHLYGRYAGGRGEPMGFPNQIPELKEEFISGSWSEIGYRFTELIESIDSLLGQGMKTLPKVVR